MFPPCGGNSARIFAARFLAQRRILGSGPAASAWWRTCKARCAGGAFQHPHAGDQQGLVRRRRRPDPDAAGQRCGDRGRGGVPCRAGRRPATARSGILRDLQRRGATATSNLPHRQEPRGGRRDLFRPAIFRRRPRRISPLSAMWERGSWRSIRRIVSPAHGAALDRGGARAPVGSPRPLCRVQT